jgi:hypothetical protein
MNMFERVLAATEDWDGLLSPVFYDQWPLPFSPGRHKGHSAANNQLQSDEQFRIVRNCRTGSGSDLADWAGYNWSLNLNNLDR